MIDRLPMRHGQWLTFEQLRDEVKKAVGAYDGTQTDLADELGVNRSSISRAMNEAGPALSSLQRRILELLYPGYTVDRAFHVLKGRSDEQEGKR